MTRRRWLVLLGLVAVAWTSLGSTGARADTIGGRSTAECVASFLAWRGSTSGWGQFRIRMHVVGKTLGQHVGVEGAWYVNGVRNSQLWSWRGGVTGFDKWSPELTLYFLEEWVTTGAVAEFRLRETYQAGGCFEVDSTTVTRYPPLTDDAPATPPPPTPTPEATARSTQGPTDPSELDPPSDGYCWVRTGGDTWQEVYCEETDNTAPSPSPTPTPAPEGGCPFAPAYGNGTFEFNFGPAGMPPRCVIWYGFPATTGTVTWAWSAGQAYRAGGTQIASALRRRSQSASFNDPAVPPGQAALGDGGLHMVGTISSGTGWIAFGASSAQASTIAGQWWSVGSCLYAGAGICNDTAGATVGLQVTLTVSGGVTWLGQDSTGAPTPSPGPSGSPEPTLTPPPGWPSPGPGGDDGGMSPVEVCDPQSIAFERAICAEQVDMEPGQGSFDQTGFDALVEGLQERAPFGYVAQVVDAVGEAAGSAPGAASDYCFTVPYYAAGGGTAEAAACLPLADAAGHAAGFRWILVALLTLAFGVALLRLAASYVQAGRD